MKLISWNVNGIRACLKKGLLDYVKDENPDVLFIQETKARPEQLEKEILQDYPYQYWNSAEKKGYSGTAIYSKIKPKDVILDMGMEEHDKEGRVLTVDLDEFYLLNVYTPNAQPELKRLPYRMQWDQDFLKYLKKLEKKKPVIFGGDLNVAHKEIDLKNPDNNHFNPGFSDEEREGISRIFESGFIDSFREFNQEPDNYTWWSYRTRARDRNVGWRIDYFILSEELKPLLKKAFIRSDVLGSDHCPVGIEIK